MCIEKYLVLRCQKKYWVALNINGIIINYIFGYKDELIKIAINNGALAAGVSGNGPSVVSVISEGEGGKIIDDWGKNECKVILTRFRGD
jgi:Archaeal shikimate kinase